MSVAGLAARVSTTGRLPFALAAGGWAFLVVQVIVGMQIGIFPSPSGDELIWDRVGDAVRSGAPIYDPSVPLGETFWYAPPLAFVFALFSWLPADLVHWFFVGVRVFSLRVIAGSWIGAGIACWFPLVAFDVGGGNFNLPVAATIVAAVRGDPRWAVWTGLAKFGPFLAIDPRQWRRALPMVLIAVGITLPWPHLWVQWGAELAANVGTQLGPQFPIGLWVRAPLALALLLAVRTRWARALAATIAIPAFYWASLVILLAPIAVYLRDRAERARPQMPRPLAMPA